MNEVLAYAQKYHAIGWQVIPLFGFSKNPAPIRWKDYQDIVQTDVEFERLFSASNITGVGLVTGRLSGVVVLDEDLYKKGGIPVAVRSGLMSETARGGKHHFFRYVEPIKSSGLREGIFVEIKADGGFVVLPPTKVVLDGVEGEYKWLEKCALEEVMEIRESDLAPYRAGGTQTVVDLMSLVHASLGSQHNNLRSFTLSVLNRFSPKEWDIAAEVVRRQAELFDPPHPKERVERMLEDCMRFVKQHPKDVDAEIQNEILHPHKINDLVEERWNDKELEKIAPKTGWPELDAKIAGFVPGHVVTFTGDTNVGKTTIACNFAEALSLQGKKTLYIALEPDVVVLDYLASVRTRKPFKELTKEDLYTKDEYIKVFKQQDIKTPTDLVRALRGIGEEHFDLIVIDHIGYFVHSEQGYIQQQSNIVKELAFLTKEFKTCVMLIAHLRKPGAQKKHDWVPTQNDISGSAAFKQDSQEVLIAYRPEIEGSLGTQFANVGKLLVTKTKSSGGNGIFDLYFTPGSAKIWSPEEARSGIEGQTFLHNRRLEDLTYNMSETEVFEKDS